MLNKALLQRSNIQEVVIEAKDSKRNGLSYDLKASVTKASTGKGSATKASAAKTSEEEASKEEALAAIEASDKDSGLQYQLVIGIKARVMLRRNIGNGLVNGSCGECVGLEWDDRHKDIIAVHVLFDGWTEPCKISRYEAEYKHRNLLILRQQFPLLLCCAITIHKCQGITLDAAMVDIGGELFAQGMAYVALSRVKEKQNLHLIAFDVSNISADKKCIEEMSRIEKLIGLPGYGPNDFNQVAKRIRPIWQRMPRLFRRHADVPLPAPLNGDSPSTRRRTRRSSTPRAPQSKRGPPKK